MKAIDLIKSRSVAIMIVMALITVCTVAPMVPVARLFTQQDERIADSLRRLAIYRAQTAMVPAFEKQLKYIEGIAAVLPGLVRAENTASAAAQMQGDLRAIVERSRGEVRSIEVVPSAPIDGFEQVTVKGEVVVPITSLREVVHGVETHVPYFFIDQLTITGPRDWPADNKNVPEPKLQIDWAVHAFRRSGPK